MSLRRCWTILWIVSVTAWGQSEIRRDADDHFEIILNRKSGAPVTILQVTDLHLGKKDFWKQDLATCKRIRKLVETRNPDLILVTGDLLTGEKYFGSLLAAFAVDFFDSLKKPWLYTFGNHDVEGGFGRDEIYDVFSSSPWCVFGYHSTAAPPKRKYDYRADIKFSPNEPPVWQVFGFDSGSEKGFKSIKQDQIAWYKTASAKTATAFGRAIPAVAAFHIPLKQFQDLWNDQAIPKSGEKREEVSFEEDDGTPCRAFVETGNIKAVLCGHDHFNNYWGKTRDGIVLSYGHISGEATHYAWPTGGKLITLPVRGAEIGIEIATPEF